MTENHRRPTVTGAVTSAVSERNTRTSGPGHGAQAGSGTLPRTSHGGRQHHDLPPGRSGEAATPSLTGKVPAPPADPAVSLDRLLQFGGYSYPFSVRSGPAAWEDLGDRLGPLAADRFALVVTEGVPAEAERPVTAILGEFAPVTVLKIPASEKAKNLSTLRDLATSAINTGVTRMSVIVGLGGGLAGNMAGLLAALLYRGMRLIHMPTTALALWDSTPSLKQAVNSEAGKNHLGMFKAPELVWGNLDFLEYLPSDEIRAAMGEAIKNVIAICPDQLETLAGLLRPDAGYSLTELAWVARMCIDAKQEVLRHDPYETKDALACEYGHTGGHLFEYLHGLSHGLAIGVGGLVAARVASTLGLLSPRAEQVHEDLLTRSGAPVMVPAGPSEREMLEVLRHDNKRGYLAPRDGHIDMVLLEDLGRLHAPGSVPITQVPESVVLQSIRSRISAGELQHGNSSRDRCGATDPAASQLWRDHRRHLGPWRDPQPRRRHRHRRMEAGHQRDAPARQVGLCRVRQAGARLVLR